MQQITGEILVSKQHFLSFLCTKENAETQRWVQRIKIGIKVFCQLIVLFQVCLFNQSSQCMDAGKSSLRLNWKLRKTKSFKYATLHQIWKWKVSNQASWICLWNIKTRYLKVSFQISFLFVRDPNYPHQFVSRIFGLISKRLINTFTIGVTKRFSFQVRLQRL